MKNNSAFIKEIFSSIQGEGPYIGYKQIFIRFCGCNLSCNYCDTDHTKEDQFQVEYLSGSNDFEYLKNPVTTKDLLSVLSKFDLSLLHSISLTGGEPLLYSEFLLEFLPEFKKNSQIKVFLETNSTLVNELKSIIHMIDIVSMDIKIPSSVNSNEYWNYAKEFLKTCKDHSKDVYTKIVVTNITTDKEVEEVAEIMRSVPVSVPLILQPITTSDENLQISPKKLFEIYDKLSRKKISVRIIPQTHRFIKIL